MSNFVFPKLSDMSPLDEMKIRHKIIRCEKNIMAIMTSLESALEWESSYTFSKTNDDKWWIQELKGITFENIETAKLYAFIDFCEHVI